MADTLRWGILGAAGIARKNWQAIKNSGNGVVTALASRDAAKAQQFIDECQAEVPFDEVPRAIGGRGIAGLLVDRLVEDARNSGFTIEPQCSYVAKKFDDNPGWADLRATPGH